MGRFRAAPAFTAVVLCTACAGSGAGPLACTEIGASSGISITVAKSMAGSIEDPKLEICDGGCRAYELELQPGSETVDLGCDTTELEGSCSASMRPNGTLVGFVVDDRLTTGEVSVTLLSGSERYSTTGTPELVYPNGRGCPGEALQLSLTLDDGALTA
jgi:hypothetical protein